MEHAITSSQHYDGGIPSHLHGDSTRASPTYQHHNHRHRTFLSLVSSGLTNKLSGSHTISCILPWLAPIQTNSSSTHYKPTNAHDSHPTTLPCQRRFAFRSDPSPPNQTTDQGMGRLTNHSMNLLLLHHRPCRNE